MSDEYYNQDHEGSGFFSLVLLAVFMLGGIFVVLTHQPRPGVGDDQAKVRQAKLTKVRAAGQDKLDALRGDDVFLNRIAQEMNNDPGKFRNDLVERSIEKDGKYVIPAETPPADDNKAAASSGTSLVPADPALVQQGKILFQTKTCFTCHQVDPKIPAPAGMAIRAPNFMGDFWGREREVHIGFGGPVKKVVFDDAYFIESIKNPLGKVVKGALAPMVLAPGLVNDEELSALMAYIKSLNRKAD